jgi:hypothetical protein
MLFVLYPHRGFYLQGKAKKARKIAQQRFAQMKKMISQSDPRM